MKQRDPIAIACLVFILILLSIHSIYTGIQLSRVIEELKANRPYPVFYKIDEYPRAGMEEKLYVVSWVSRELTYEETAVNGGNDLDALLRSIGVKEHVNDQ